MRVSRITTGVLILLAACQEPPISPSRTLLTAPSLAVGNGAHAVWVRRERSYSDTTSTCEGDAVAVEVQSVAREQIVFLPTGGLRATIHATLRMRGTVLSSGVQYVGQWSLVEVHVYHGPDSKTPPTETRTLRLHGVTQGPSDNVFETITFLTTYGPENGWTVVIRGKAACPG